MSPNQLIESVNEFLATKGLAATQERDGVITYWSLRLSSGLLIWLAVDHESLLFDASVSFGELKRSATSDSAIELLEANYAFHEGLRFYVSCKRLVSLGFHVSLKYQSDERIRRTLSLLLTTSYETQERACRDQMPFRLFAWAKRVNA